MTVININLFNHKRSCYINSANNKSTLLNFDSLLTDAFIILDIFCQLFLFLTS